MKKLFICTAITGVLLSCGPSRFVDPLKRGEQAFSGSLGGPIINVPGIASIPIPFTSLTYGKGLTDNTTLYGSWFSTAAIFGTFQFEMGATHRLWKDEENTRGLSITPAFNIGTDKFEWNTKIWPQLDMNYYWKYNWKHQTQDELLNHVSKVPNMLYAGIGSWYELAGKRAHDLPQSTRVIPMLQVGHDLNWKSWTFSTELKVLAPFTSNENVVTDYKSILGRYGATGLYIGLTKRF